MSGNLLSAMQGRLDAHQSFLRIRSTRTSHSLPPTPAKGARHVLRSPIMYYLYPVPRVPIATHRSYISFEPSFTILRQSFRTYKSVAPKDGDLHNTTSKVPGCECVEKESSLVWHGIQTSTLVQSLSTQSFEFPPPLTLPGQSDIGLLRYSRYKRHGALGSMEPDVKQALKALQYPSDAKLARVTGRKHPCILPSGENLPKIRHTHWGCAWMNIAMHLPS